MYDHGNQRTKGQSVDSSMLVIGYNNKATAANEQQQQQRNCSFTLMIALISTQEAQDAKEISFSSRLLI